MPVCPVSDSNLSWVGGGMRVGSHAHCEHGGICSGAPAALNEQLAHCRDSLWMLRRPLALAAAASPVELAISTWSQNESVGVLSFLSILLEMLCLLQLG